MSGAPPLVSVALVTFRHRAFIEECLQAILHQDYPAIEIIVADDHSDDGSKEVIAAVAAANPGRLTVLESDRNLGILANHQRALDACTGKYIAWMAGDDLMKPGKIAAQVALMEADPICAVCYHDLNVVDVASGATLYRSSAVDRPREGGIETLARYGAFNLGTSNMVRASASVPFDPHVPYAFDWLYYTQCLAGGGTIRHIARVLGEYRRHRGNITHSKNKSPPRALFDDHVASCDILLAQHPQLGDAIAERKSKLFAQQRWDDGGGEYARWLLASLRQRFSSKIALALVANLLFAVKR